jgi:hypothetical protein
MQVPEKDQTPNPKPYLPGGKRAIPAQPPGNALMRRMKKGKSLHQQHEDHLAHVQHVKNTQ